MTSVNHRIEPRIYNGTRDFLPAEMRRREAVLEAMRGAFRLYGFAPVETPTIEYLEILLGKYGDEEQLIYKLDYRNDQPDRRLALRYDLTVPLARLVAMHPELPLPFKRYQLQPVWRADRPQPNQGRFREFVQCDIDTVGSASLSADAEVLAVCCELLQRLRLPDFVIRINHRRLLSALTEAAGLPLAREGAICAAIDKLDKIGLAGVEQELARRDIPTENARRLLDWLAIDAGLEDLHGLQALGSHSALAEPALRELDELRGLLDAFGLPREHLRLDLYLARGLSYYSGPIFEAVLPGLPHMGSVMGGGRYDGLVGLFLGRELPATGATLGLDRLLTALEQLALSPAGAEGPQVLVARAFAETDGAALALATALRARGVAVELALEQEKLKKPFARADKLGIPWVLLIGPEELERGEVRLKHLPSGGQRSLGRGALLADPARALDPQGLTRDGK
jgi:histidyl-tRNA synthetase